jgi:CPA1 family monovalent cation:H+ antiporter
MQQYETISRIKEQLERSINATEKTLNEENKKHALASVRKLYRDIMLELIALRRAGLNEFRLEKKYDDEVIREMEHNLDLEEARLNKN